MAASFSLPTVLANLAAGNQPLALIDGDFTALANPLLALGTFGNYYADTGAANAYVITVSSPQTVALAAGLPVQFKAANTNTGASTLAINALGVKNILNADNTALQAGQIPANGIIQVQYDGTSFLLSTLSPVVISGQKVQSFSLVLTVTAGVVQHQIVSDSGNASLGNFSDRINGASATLTTTPTGTDSSTAFAAGAKISSVNANTIILDTAAQTAASFIGGAYLEFASPGGASVFQARGVFNSRNVNGTTRVRLEIQFNANPGGGTLSLSAPFGANGTFLMARFFGYLA